MTTTELKGLITRLMEDFIDDRCCSEQDRADSRTMLAEALAAVDKIATAERERCARLCDWLPVGTGLQGKTFAEAIRGTGMGGDLAKGFEA